MKKHLMVLTTLSACIFLSACNDSSDSDSSSSSSNVPENNIQNPVVGIPAAYTQSGMDQVAGESVVMTYKMLGISGQEVLATSLIFTPKGTPPSAGWPIVAWAHGTTGVADICAPSRNVMDENVKTMITQLLAQGYVVVAPDYEGLGEPNGKEIHPFLNVKSEAYSITDAVVAAKSYLGAKAATRWVAVGHSQGGQAALGAAQYASRAKLTYKGTIAVAPASNLDLILNAGELSAANQPVAVQIPTYTNLDTYTALITAGLRNPNPSLQYSQIFKSPSDKIAAQAESVCAPALAQSFALGLTEYSNKNNNTLVGYGRTQDGFLNLPVVKNFTSTDGQPLTVKVSTPIKIYQGQADTTVPFIATNKLVTEAKLAGTNINFITNPTWTHGSAYSLNISNIVTDVNTLFTQ
ncbi:alpha/beta hydrolase [Acinetobacter soli]|uniref:alpha/beta hydrolase n=1 Tax=Acinetobacter soli TaxID=487316 RepID=UPI000DCFCA1A|nr:alpha/beta fold hydrolase [Acinetobacter soli]RSB50268.1 alpha/beta fold hydrolase [Acinetobacter soli]